mmetsp:Transcript_2441/g.9342  ORF Transcript_2441/g.9342 Transcript_2441/m.9342 type:complete len:246 (+) Transcript_2441:451-1188(+)
MSRIDVDDAGDREAREGRRVQPGAEGRRDDREARARRELDAVNARLPGVARPLGEQGADVDDERVGHEGHVDPVRVVLVDVRRVRSTRGGGLQGVGVVVRASGVAVAEVDLEALRSIGVEIEHGEGRRVDVRAVAHLARRAMDRDVARVGVVREPHARAGARRVGDAENLVARRAQAELERAQHDAAQRARLAEKLRHGRLERGRHGVVALGAVAVLAARRRQPRQRQRLDEVDGFREVAQQLRT